MRQPSVYKGDVIECSECKLDAYDVTADIYYGQILTPLLFKSRYKYIKEVEKGDITICGECKTLWFKQGQLHLQRYGWTG